MVDDLNEDFDDMMEDDVVEFEPDEELIDQLDESATPGRAGYGVRGREAISRAGEAGRERLYQAADRGKVRLADAIDQAGRRIDGRLAHTADYLRTTDVDTIQSDFARHVRRRPLLSVSIALGAGYLLGRALRIGR